MSFAVSDPESAAVCQGHFPLALEGEEAVADVDATVQILNTKRGGEKDRSRAKGVTATHHRLDAVGALTAGVRPIRNSMGIGLNCNRDAR